MGSGSLKVEPVRGMAKQWTDRPEMLIVGSPMHHSLVLLKISLVSVSKFNLESDKMVNLTLL